MVLSMKNKKQKQIDELFSLAHCLDMAFDILKYCNSKEDIEAAHSIFKMLLKKLKELLPEPMLSDSP